MQFTELLIDHFTKVSVIQYQIYLRFDQVSKSNNVYGNQGLQEMQWSKFILY